MKGHITQSTGMHAKRPLTIMWLNLSLNMLPAGIPEQLRNSVANSASWMLCSMGAKTHQQQIIQRPTSKSWSIFCPCLTLNTRQLHMFREVHMWRTQHLSLVTGLCTLCHWKASQQLCHPKHAYIIISFLKREAPCRKKIHVQAVLRIIGSAFLGSGHFRRMNLKASESSLLQQHSPQEHVGASNGGEVSLQMTSTGNSKQCHSFQKQ